MRVYKYVCIILAFPGGTLLLGSAVTKSATQWDLFSVILNVVGVRVYVR